MNGKKKNKFNLIIPSSESTIATPSNINPAVQPVTSNSPPNPLKTQQNEDSINKKPNIDVEKTPPSSITDRNKLTDRILAFVFLFHLF